ncbi:MAG: FHA domain-containing protein [Oscillospiraceae bacterium]|jgi:pSer/pThr/pTyr-binding forkhead associated (FHA) protein|nr:FHA domain-containing protein [Oscillospiraceae bacterium]
MEDILLSANRILLPLLGAALVTLCLLWVWRRNAQPPPEAWLLNTLNRDRLALSHWENSVGRHPRCDLLLNYATVSRFHAVIARRREGWVLMDTGSHGGTRINGLPAQPKAPLHHGDLITFGNFEFLFCDREEEQAQQNALEAEIRRQGG